MKRIAIAWPGFTGYMGPCFRALAKKCELRLYLEPSAAYEQAFDGSDLAGLCWRRVEDAAGRESVVRELRDWAPDLVMVCGWHTPLAKTLARAAVPGRKVLEFDMPWEWRLRKLVAPIALWSVLRHYDAAFVPGRRCARYARWLGFRGARLVLGANPGGWERFAEVPSVWSKRFLFVGRFVQDKGLDVLLKAYAQYRTQAAAPWGLDLVGSGRALPKELPEGVRVLGFVKPCDMPRVMGEHACLVLPSRWEPWGVCAAEAMSAGRATILSDRCGITDDVKPTRVVPFGDVARWAEALASVAKMSDADLAAEAAFARSQMKDYSAERWAERVENLCAALCTSVAKAFLK